MVDFATRRCSNSTLQPVGEKINSYTPLYILYTTQHSIPFTVYDNEKFLASSLQQLRSAVRLCIHVNTYVALISSNCCYQVSIKLKYTETKQLDCNLQQAA